MKRLLLFLSLVFALNLSATPVKFDLGTFNAGSTTNRKVLITPLDGPRNVGGVLIGNDGLMFTNSTVGGTVLSNMVAGNYLGEMLAPPARTPFYFTVPDTTNEVLVSTLLVTQLDNANGFAYGRTNSDARYLNLETNGTISTADTNFFRANSNLLNAAVAPSSGGGGGSGDSTNGVDAALRAVVIATNAANVAAIAGSQAAATNAARVYADDTFLPTTNGTYRGILTGTTNFVLRTTNSASGQWNTFDFNIGDGVGSGAGSSNTVIRLLNFDGTDFTTDEATLNTFSAIHIADGITRDTELSAVASTAALNITLVSNQIPVSQSAATNAAKVYAESILAAQGTAITNTFETKSAAATSSNNLVSAIQGTNTALRSSLATQGVAVTNAYTAEIAAKTNFSMVHVTNEFSMGDEATFSKVRFTTDTNGNFNIFGGDNGLLISGSSIEDRVTIHRPNLYIPEPSATNSAATKAYVDSHSGGGSGIQGVTNQNVIYVGKDGSDSSGTSNRLDKKFLTLTAAQTAWQGGQTIHVFPGIYAEALGNQPAGIRWHFEQGADIDSNVTNRVFAVTNGTVTITGYANFTNRFNDGLGLTSPAGSNCVFEITGGHLNLQANWVESTAAGSTAFRHIAGSTTIDVKEKIKGAGFGYSWISGPFDIHCKHLIGSGSQVGGFWCDYRDSDVEISDKGNISCETISGLFVYLHTTSDPESRVWLVCKEVLQNIDVGGAPGTPCRVYVTAQKVGGSIDVGSSAQFWLLGDPKVSGAVTVVNADTWLNASRFESTINITGTNLSQIAAKRCDGQISLINASNTTIQINEIYRPILTMGDVATVRDSRINCFNPYFTNGIIVTAGADYTENDEVTLDGGGANSVFRVSVDGGGGVTSLIRLTVGTGYTTGTYNVTGGSGTGLQISITLIDEPCVKPNPDGDGTETINLFNVTSNTDVDIGITVATPAHSWN